MFKSIEPTERELQIITYISQGLTHKEVADKLFLAEVTVKNHVKRICLKFNCKSRLELVLYSLHKNYISNPFDEEETCITVAQS